MTLAIVRALEKETPDASGVTGSYVWGFPKDNAQPQNFALALPSGLTSTVATEMSINRPEWNIKMLVYVRF